MSARVGSVRVARRAGHPFGGASSGSASSDN